MSEPIPDTDAKTVLVEAGAVTIITLNRPDKLNALNHALLTELLAALHAVESDPKVRAVVLTGSGQKAFAAGADIAAMANMTPAEARAFAELGHSIGSAMEQSRVPIIGAINGFALGGGCELALACDFLYASENAKFGQPEVNLGVIPGFGGTQRLSRRVGIGRSRELCYTGDIIDVKEALRIGLVNGVVLLAELMDKAIAVATKIAEKGPLAIAQAKRTILRGADVPLTIANELEAQAFATLFGSQDQKEGMSAFLEKRKAAFKGA
jgi:enoyl-CoA hydratase